MSIVNWINKRDIKIILFDGDDTLWSTIPVFVDQLDKCFEYLSKVLPIYSKAEWKEKIETINNRAFEKLGVNPKRWIYVVEELGLSEAIKIKAQKILMDIYKIPLVLLPNTDKTLQMLCEHKIKIGVVTHANRDWTFKKYNWLKLDRFLKWEDIYIVDENGHKTKESWKTAMDYFGVKPENVMVVGDSPRADIIPNEELGVKARVLIKNPNAHHWSIHDLPVNEDTIVVEDIGDIRYLRD